MNAFTAPTAIRRLLIADALISGVTGIAMIALAGAVEPLLNIPSSLMRVTGVVLLPFAAMVLYFAKQVTRSRVWTVVTLNLAWVAGSVLILVEGLIEPTALGTAFVVFQALVVAALAELQFVGLRRSLAAA
jgi:hypothetical protein